MEENEQAVAESTLQSCGNKHMVNPVKFLLQGDKFVPPTT